MTDSLLTRSLCLTVLVLANACARAGHLSSDCVPAPSRATWATTTRDGRLQGKVIDLKEETPMGNVEVVLDNGVTRQRSDTTGSFAFDGVPEGRHVITTHAAAYLVRGDTIMMPMRGGLAGTLSLKLRQDVLKKCELYHP